MGSLSVAVIGAGAAGLAAARELRREGHGPVVVFERCAGVGGTWLYDDKVSTNHHSSLYASLRTNLPRETMGFLDFPLVSSDSGDSRRFPGHAEVLRYLQEFARRFDLHGMVKLQTEVLSVRREASSSWKVTYSRKQEEKEVIVEEEVFDAVVVCNGHFTHPRLADIAGIDGWPGKQMHSHSYRVADPFHGQVVVVIGYKPSGMDISRDIAGVAKEVHVAIRSPAAAAANISQTQQMPLPANQAHPNLWLHSCTVERAEGDGSVVFQDGSRVKADAIVHCTGYVRACAYTSIASRSWTRTTLASTWTTTVSAHCTSMSSRHDWLLTSPSSDCPSGQCFFQCFSSKATGWPGFCQEGSSSHRRRR
ncbi:hypothetical protein BRADI_1g78290v3 [Brachypodium distachyon]|uniref:Flavin-containing monooxygenase n=1 Tax=Brachypodium distachyon TaxID=15368 RepID=A0A2K2DVS3_BRADI|nr:hypothetical protein BRADI_1g78290v3 [Brachypodium distachyon]PNT78373.1 hypothetical protein BRADI_1g78290v3 [Brachypodium distachyon]